MPPSIFAVSAADIRRVFHIAGASEHAWLYIACTYCLIVRHVRDYVFWPTKFF